MTASADADARLWDAGTGAELQLFRGHFGTVFEASFSPDGRWVVTAGPVIAGLWEVETGSLLFYLRGNLALLTGATFDPTGDWIMTTNGSGGVRLYQCQVCGPLDDLVPLAEEHLDAIGRELTDEERTEFGLDLVDVLARYPGPPPTEDAYGNRSRSRGMTRSVARPSPVGTA